MENLIEKVGAFGKFQILNLFLIGSLAALVSTTIYSTIFVLAFPILVCKTLNSNDSFKDSYQTCDILRNNSISKTFNSTQDDFYSCEFDKTYYGKTLATEWNLVCDRKYMLGLTQTIYMFGTICGVLVGYFGDRFGRYKCSITILFLLTISLLISQIMQLEYFNFSVPTRYIIYCIGQFFIGLFAYCLYMAIYVLIFEITTEKYHIMISILLLVFYVFGELFIMIIAYFFRDWRTINWIITSMSILLSIICFFFLPESPKWLVSKRKYVEALILFKKISKLNNKEFNEDEILDMREEEIDIDKRDENLLIREDKKLTKDIKTLLCSKKELLKIVALTYIRIAVSMIYYGVGLGVTGLSGSINPYVIYVFQSLFEIVGYTLSLLNNRFGHRKMNIFYYFCAALICIIICFLPKTAVNETNSNKILFESILLISLTAIGKCVVSASFNTWFVYTSEFYDTSIRSFVLTALSCIGNIGSILAPQVNLLSDLWKPSSYLIFSFSSLLSCIIVFILPDTRSNKNKHSKK